IRALDERRERQLRKRAQEALRRSEERFQFAVQATQEVIWDRDMARGMVSFNDALEKVWGHRPETSEVPVEWWEARIHPEDRPEILASLEEAIRHDQRWAGAF